MDPKTFDLLTKMLEKDPSKRITADVALSHPYFLGDMDIEMEEKPFAFMSALGTKGRETSKFSSTPLDKPSYFNNSLKEDARYLYI